MNKQDYFDEIKTYKLLANKSLGQNFLINPDCAEEIVEMLDVQNNDDVLEIGAGLGSLSYFLASKDCNTTLIDVDDKMINVLDKKFGNVSNVTVLRQNILKYDVSKFNRIIGNLPYYITSGILKYLLLNAINAEKIVVMVQKEVYQKIVDKNEISPLNLFIKYVARVELGKHVGKTNFAPVPHVDSSYFAIIPNENIKNENNKELFELMSKLFLLRRKTIMNNLGSVLKDKEKASKILVDANISANLRPEQLKIEDYIRLLEILRQNNLISNIM